MKKVLSVGQCGPDHAGIVAFLSRHFPDVVVDTAKLPAETMEKLAAGSYDLVLVNRKLDEDYSDGLAIIKAIKADPKRGTTPVMLVTNYAEHQDAAVSAGALYGFGKLEYGEPEVIERVREVLG
ncbi:chemotaxis regulatory protein CheY [Botrimarina colliarenosi]|uniref:Chemotaxis regulatory protein CheY n=1 Tax=Botrimarina colliarenosi TaxID=2528001 RepID=A0A5C6AID6_9BACT|nr:response regulator [Botrimarina colliarenosi]TWT99237.1 chemotaxis regulatory protein CheY [Botrimarina colliarenosi]